MLEAAAWGLIAASSLVIGSVLTFWLKPSRRLIDLIMAFGAGACALGRCRHPGGLSWLELGL